MYQSKKREQSCEQRPATGDWRVWRARGAHRTAHRQRQRTIQYSLSIVFPVTGELIFSVI